MSWADKIIDSANDQAVWLRGVLLGEWEDNRSISQIVTDALAGLALGVGNVLAFRDLIAIIVRLTKHPEKREEIEEWILLIAMLLPLALTLGGAMVAGVGALVGAELGGFLRALILMLVKKGGVGLKALIEFFQHHGYGNVVNALRQVKFGSYQSVVVKALDEQIVKLRSVCENLKSKLQTLNRWPDWLPGHEAATIAIAKLESLAKALTQMQSKARSMIPQALKELDARLGQILAGDISAAVNSTHTIATGVKAEKVARAEAAGEQTGKQIHAARTAGEAEPGNVRRVKERRLVATTVNKANAEYRLANSKGIPVGAKPYHEGKTVYENPQLPEQAWIEKKSSVQDGYPDLTAKDRRGKAMTKYDTFSKIEPYDAKPGEHIVRVVGSDNPNWGSSWTRELPEDGRQFRAGTAVKEAWNSDGSYVGLKVPPKGDVAWQEIHEVRKQRAAAAGFDPDKVPYDETIKTWKGPASAQRYEYDDPLNPRKKIQEDFYLPGGDEQLYVDPEELKVLEKHKKFDERKATNFKDYDPTIKNPDGTTGNIVPTGDLIFEQVPKSEAIIAAKGGNK